MKIVLFLCASLLLIPNANGAQRPNVVWFIVDDMSPNFSCYGEQLIQTPNVDRLAREGMRFGRAFVVTSASGDATRRLDPIPLNSGEAALSATLLIDCGEGQTWEDYRSSCKRSRSLT
jgi:hypothetical protein